MKKELELTIRWGIASALGGHDCSMSSRADNGVSKLVRKREDNEGLVVKRVKRERGDGGRRIKYRLNEVAGRFLCLASAARSG